MHIIFSGLKSVAVSKISFHATIYFIFFCIHVICIFPEPCRSLWSTLSRFVLPGRIRFIYHPLLSVNFESKFFIFENRQKSTWCRISNYAITWILKYMSGDFLNGATQRPSNFGPTRTMNLHYQIRQYIHLKFLKLLYVHLNKKLTNFVRREVGEEINLSVV